MCVCVHARECVRVRVLALAVHIELAGDSQYEEKLSYYDCLTHTHRADM